MKWELYELIICISVGLVISTSINGCTFDKDDKPVLDLSFSEFKEDYYFNITLEPGSVYGIQNFDYVNLSKMREYRWVEISHTEGFDLETQWDDFMNYGFYGRSYSSCFRYEEKLIPIYNSSREIVEIEKKRIDDYSACTDITYTLRFYD